MNVLALAAALGVGACGEARSLLCNLGNALSGLASRGGAGPGAGGIVNALNNVI